MLPIQQTQDQDLMLMQTQWAGKINPVLSNLLVNGNLLKNISLSNGTTLFNHYLGRQMQGWWVVDQNASANIFRPSTAPLNSQTLTLTSNAIVTVNIWVF